MLVGLEDSTHTTKILTEANEQFVVLLSALRHAIGCSRAAGQWSAVRVPAMPALVCAASAAESRIGVWLVCRRVCPRPVDGNGPAPSRLDSPRSVRAFDERRTSE